MKKKLKKKSTTIITEGKEAGAWLTLARKSFESVAEEVSLLTVFSPPVLLAEWRNNKCVIYLYINNFDYLLFQLQIVPNRIFYHTFVNLVVALNPQIN